MSETFDKLKAQLNSQGKLSDDDIKKMIEAHGTMSDEEQIQLSAAMHEKERAQDQKITLEQYLEASKVLDSAAEGSDEYKKAEKIVEQYESGG
ncbi:MAG: hypothetical protein H6672_21335 [Anaerolineaceae bacterium]|nr:hypothetical protein [Anaerolineaceae bacterium]